MHQESEYEKEERAKATLRAYCDKLLHHWKWFVSSSFLGVVFSLFGGTLNCLWMILGMALTGLFVASFYAWQDEYVEKRKAQQSEEESQKIPDISGVWKRKHPDTLVMVIKQNGDKISSDFSFGTARHEMDGVYNPKTRKFVVTTIRSNSALSSKNKTVMHGVCGLWDKNSNILVYVNKGTDGNGELPIDFSESGTYERFEG